MRLIIVRHGETEENKKGVLQAQLPGKLTDVGIWQAKKLAKRLKKEKIDVIFSSDLSRAADTAKEIIKFHPNVNLFYVKELREFKNEILQGKKITNYNNIDWNNPKKGVETKSEGLKRAKKFLKNVFVKYKTKNVLFVTHGFFTRALVAAIRGKGENHIDEIEISGNTGVNVFDIYEDGSHKMHLFNCMKHLKND